MDEALTYEIRTVTDFLTVPEDRREICIREFGAWLSLAGGLKELLGDLPCVGEPAWGVFKWIDDDKSEATVKIVTPDDDVIWQMQGRI